MRALAAALAVVACAGCGETARSVTRTVTHAAAQRVPATPPRLGEGVPHAVTEPAPGAHDLDLATLIPRTAALDGVWAIEASGSEPPQVLVEWHRTELVAPKGATFADEHWSVYLWTRVARRPYGSWRWTSFPVLARSDSFNRVESIIVADITHDGHADVLLHDDQGNHGTGPFRIVATLDGSPRVLLAESQWFETSWSVVGGDVRVDQADMTNARSLCCPTGMFHITYSWTGNRLVVVRRSREALRN